MVPEQLSLYAIYLVPLSGCLEMFPRYGSLSHFEHDSFLSRLTPVSVDPITLPYSQMGFRFQTPVHFAHRLQSEALVQT